MRIVGFGRIGQAAGRIAKAFGMKVLAFDNYPNEAGKEIAEYVSLDELYAESDVISLHCPLPVRTDLLYLQSRLFRQVLLHFHLFDQMISCQ